MQAMLRDLRYAVRVLLKNRGFSAAAILTLALGIGVNTSIFSIADGMLFRPLPFRDPDRLALVMGFSTRQQVTYSRVPRLDYEELRRSHSSFEAMAVLDPPTDLTLVGSDGADSVSIAGASANLLDVLGVAPVLGRGFRPDDEAAQPRVALLTFGAWRRRFGADPAIVGRTVVFEERRFATYQFTNFTFPQPERSG
jgi:hypothetical protein